MQTFRIQIALNGREWLRRRLQARGVEFLRHAWITGNSANVLRYLGRPLTAAGKPHARCANEVMSRVLDFRDGLRVRHGVDHNSVKLQRQNAFDRTVVSVCPSANPTGAPGPRFGSHMLAASTEELLKMAA